MAFTEEVYRNMGKWYGARTGKAYEASEVEDFGAGGSWSKACHYAPNEVALQLEFDPSDKPYEPHEKNEK